MDNPIFIGKVLHHFELLTSTNVYATELLSKSNPSEGTVISTYNQTAGRGQIGSQWESAPGRNLSLSVILYPNFIRPTDQFLLNKAISLGVQAFLSQLTNQKVYIKWPNDLFINDKKIGGILIQNNISSTQIISSVVGIGLNINQKNFRKAPNPISLSILESKFFDLDELRIKLFASLEYYYLRLKAADNAFLNDAYLCNLYRFDKMALYANAGGERFMGRIRNVDEFGRLVMEVKNNLQFFNIKEIQLIQ